MTNLNILNFPNISLKKARGQVQDTSKGRDEGTSLILFSD